MRLIAKGRQCGKTTEALALFKELAEKDRKIVFVCFSTNERDRVRHLCPELAHRVITFEQYERERPFGHPDRKAIIDNLDHYLRSKFGTVIAATVDLSYG